MSSSDRDVSAVKSTVDENVPRMNDTTNEEKEYYKHNRLWASDDSDHCWRSFLLSPGILSLLGVPVLLVGVWTLVQGTTYFSFAMLPSTSVIIVAAHVIVGAVMFLGGISHILFARLSGTQDCRRLVTCVSMFFILYSLPIVVIALGIAAAALIPSLSGTTKFSASTTFNNYLSDQSVQENFDNVQHNFKCCGVVAFTDYKNIFYNLSVPLSCCNTTNFPLANMITCPKIVSNAQQANQTGLIYSEGCVTQLQSVLHHILSVVAGVSIMIGVLQILGNAMSWCCCY